MLTTLLANHAHGWGDGPGPWLIVPLLFLALWIAVLAFVAVRLRRGGGPPWARPGGESVLAERYARGEIDADEYRRRRDVLREAAR
ncbi:MAG TPA: SHOCT domain-containing protein [Acidimicrobiales bacterium]